jgi:hypothetical protein
LLSDCGFPSCGIPFGLGDQGGGIFPSLVHLGLSGRKGLLVLARELLPELLLGCGSAFAFPVSDF